MRYYFTTFTVTIADPGVFTCADHGLYPGDEVILETTGALPTGLSEDTKYYVVRQGITENTFQLSASKNDANDATAITTTGTQSGTHTFLKVNIDRLIPSNKSADSCR